MLLLLRYLQISLMSIFPILITDIGQPESYSEAEQFVAFWLEKHINIRDE